MSNEVTAYQEKVGALSPLDVRAQVNLVQHIMREVMKDGEHYGVIPGTNKPTLLKAGAEKLCLTFRLDPQYEIEQKQEGNHLTIVSKCTLWHIPSGQRYGSGMGSCSTKESKYAYRQGKRKCPECGAESIIKGKDFKGDGKPTGWICFAKKGGCGAKFLDGDEKIEGQKEGRVPNEDIPDAYNTVLKMANKRSLVAAVLNTTAASDIFTQDIEDMPEFTHATPQASIPPEKQASPIPAKKPAGDAPFPNDDGKITLEQGMDIAEALSKLDARATEDFLRAAKVSRIDDLPAELDGTSGYDRAMSWCHAREAYNKKKGKQ